METKGRAAMTERVLTKDQKLRELFAAVGTRGELARISRRYLRSTPEYATARSQGRARSWLDAEAALMGDYLYEAMSSRVLED